VLAELEPYVTLAEKLDKLAVAAGVGGPNYVKVTYASTRVSDYFDAQLLRAMIAKRVGMSVKWVILDGSPEKPVKSIQVQIAKVELICFTGAISESRNIIVEGLLKNGVPRLTRVGAFKVDASLKGNIILCVVEPEIAGSSKSLLRETNLQSSFTRFSSTVGKQAFRVIVVDKKPRLKTLKKIIECPGVKQVLCVALQSWFWVKFVVQEETKAGCFDSNTDVYKVRFSRLMIRWYAYDLLLISLFHLCHP
nr:hypothetical protein [Tanacetum cinerariifolium]